MIEILHENIVFDLVFASAASIKIASRVPAR
jgi:hypothetical protein